MNESELPDPVITEDFMKRMMPDMLFIFESDEDE